MPLQLSKLRRNKGLKVSSSQGSLASSASQVEGGDCVYTVSKVKDLPKLHRAVWKEDIDKVKSFTNGIRKAVLNNRDKQKRTALHLACAKGLDDIVLHLCATCKADSNVQDADGATPMHRVIESKSSAPLQYLLDCGGNPNLSDKNGHTPLHVASRVGDCWATSLLLEREARIDAIDRAGHTALHIATLHGHQKLIAMLIQDGADINCQDGEGKSCLIMACGEGSIELVKLLCNNKADPELTDCTSFNALDYSITRNHHDCARIIEDYRIAAAKGKRSASAHTGPLVDPALIHASYGVGGARGTLLDGGPAMGHPHSPAYSEDTPSLREPSPLDENSWAVSETEEMLDQLKPSAAATLYSRPHPQTPPSAEWEEPALRTTDEPISDFASHQSADFSEDIHFSPAVTTPSPTHSRVEGHKAGEKGGSRRVYFPVPEFSDDAEEVDFDSDISGLLSDGDYVPSSALGAVEKGRASAHPVVSGTSPGGLSGGMASREGTPPRIQVNRADSDDLQDKPNVLQDKPSILQDRKPDFGSDSERRESPYHSWDESSSSPAYPGDRPSSPAHPSTSPAHSPSTSPTLLSPAHVSPSTLAKFPDGARKGSLLGVMVPSLSESDSSGEEEEVVEITRRAEWATSFSEYGKGGVVRDLTREFSEKAMVTIESHSRHSRSLQVEDTHGHTSPASLASHSQPTCCHTLPSQDCSYQSPAHSHSPAGECQSPAHSHSPASQHQSPTHSHSPADERQSPQSPVHMCHSPAGERRSPQSPAHSHSPADERQSAASECHSPAHSHSPAIERQSPASQHHSPTHSHSPASDHQSPAHSQSPPNGLHPHSPAHDAVSASRYNDLRTPAMVSLYQAELQVSSHDTRFTRVGLPGAELQSHDARFTRVGSPGAELQSHDHHSSLQARTTRMASPVEGVGFRSHDPSPPLLPKTRPTSGVGFQPQIQHSLPSLPPPKLPVLLASPLKTSPKPSQRLQHTCGLGTSSEVKSAEVKVEKVHSQSHSRVLPPVTGGRGKEGVNPPSNTSLTTTQSSAPPTPQPRSQVGEMRATDTDTEDISQTSLTTSHVSDSTHESKFERYLKKTDHLCVLKSRLEQQVLQLELENRKLRYEADQSWEGARINEVVRSQLRDQLDRLESRLGSEVEGRQMAELRVRELEVKMRSVKVSQQQAMEEGERLKALLQAESEARILQEGIYQEQVRVFQSLQSESEKALGQQSELQCKLAEVDSCRSKAEEKLSELAVENGKLKMDLAALKQNGDEVENQLEVELDTFKTQLHEARERGLSVETTLLDSQQSFKANLKELKEKASMLSSALDREVETKADVIDELTRVRAELDRVLMEQRELYSSTSDKEKMLCQQLAEAVRDNAVKDNDLKNTKESLHQQTSRVESLKGKLHLAETNAKSFEALASERAHQITSLERECKVREDRLSAKEEAASGKDSKVRELETKMAASAERVAALQIEKERLSQQIEFGQHKLHENGSAVVQAQNRFDTLLQSVRGDQHKIGSLEESLAAALSDRKVWEERAAKLEAALSQQNEAQRRAAEEKQALLEEKLALKGNLTSLEAKFGVQGAELEVGLGRERDTAKELERLIEVRGTLEGLLSAKQDEVIRLQHRLEQTNAAHEKASREAKETRGLWEAEVMTKSRLGQKLEDMQREVMESKSESQGMVAAEKRKTRKALELKKTLECRVEPVQQQCAQLQDELASLRSQLRAAKQQARQASGQERQLQEAKQQQEEERDAMEMELRRMRELLEDTSQQLKKEGETRMRDVAKVKQDLELSHSQLNQEQLEISTAQRECSKLERANRKLKEEMGVLQDEVAEDMVSKSQMEAYKKEVDLKARRELTKKLEEVNVHMDQQSQAQESLLRLRNTMESEWRVKYEHACDEVRGLKAKLMTEEVAIAENSRLKELFEGEIRRSEKLLSQLNRSKGETSEYRTKLSLEHSRTQQLITATQTAAASLHPHSPPSTRPSLAHLTSTPRLSLLTKEELAHHNELLSSVRTQLDSSIARHLERSSGTTVPTRSIGKATRSTYGDTKYSPLDSICSNYHI